MKTLLVIRHAKSDHSNSHLSDFERPLNERGIEEAKILGKALRKAQLFPEYILSSPAKRALDTAKLILKKKNHNILHLWEDLYPGSIDSAFEAIRTIPEHVHMAALIGHNPALETFVAKLISRGDAMVRLTTATAAVVDLQIDRWKEAESDNASLRLLFSGKIIRSWL
ncbi:MAG: histidine phosphatase family protein [Leptospiraceae bacterium]|nr:histidine phosphatase family protein [Leptospiraceae bacterium]MDW8307475.1 histidine phosphatase family protein [Leptospiraceae bacterium]